MTLEVKMFCATILHLSQKLKLADIDYYYYRLCTGLCLCWYHKYTHHLNDHLHTLAVRLALVLERPST